MVKQEHSSRIGALEVWGNISRGNVWRREEEGKRKRGDIFGTEEQRRKGSKKYLRRKQKNNMIA